MVQRQLRLSTTNTIDDHDPTLAAAGEGPGRRRHASTPQKFWGAMQSQGAPSVQGDAYMTDYRPRGPALIANRATTTRRVLQLRIEIPPASAARSGSSTRASATRPTGPRDRGPARTGPSAAPTATNPPAGERLLRRCTTRRNTPYEYQRRHARQRQRHAPTVCRLDGHRPRRSADATVPAARELRRPGLAQRLVAARQRPAGRHVPPIHSHSDECRPTSTATTRRLDGPERLRLLRQVDRRHAAGLRPRRDGGLLPAARRPGVRLLPGPDRGGPRRQDDGHRPVGPGRHRRAVGEPARSCSRRRGLRPRTRRARSTTTRSPARPSSPPTSPAVRRTPAVGPTTRSRPTPAGPSYNGTGCGSASTSDDNYTPPRPASGETEPGWWKIRYTMGGTGSTIRHGPDDLAGQHPRQPRPPRHPVTGDLVMPPCTTRWADQADNAALKG